MATTNKKYKVAVTWEMCGYVEVEAKNLQDAMDKVMENPDDYPLPNKAEYVDGSFWIATEDIDEMEIISSLEL